MGLSVTEKQELRSIISKRISQRIDQLKGEQKDLLVTVSEQARIAAHSHLGIEVEIQTLDQLTTRKAALEREIDAAELTVYGRIKHLEHALYNSRQDRIRQIVSRVQKPLEAALLQATPLGQQIAALTAEQGHLDETVWAATSPKQVSEIFQALNAVLDQQPTALEQAAHAMPHPDD